jgi:hypothetical protein
MKKIILAFALFAYIGTTTASALVSTDNVCVVDNNEKGKEKKKKKGATTEAGKSCSGEKAQSDAKPACAKSQAEGKSCCAKKAEAAAPEAK